MESRTVQAFAKINLILDILGKRADGYHAIRSVMQAIRLHDRIMVDVKGAAGLFGGVRVKLSVTDPAGQTIPDMPEGEDNLAYRAALCLAEHFCPSRGNHVNIRIQKRIPVEAGLAGGSTDAAAVLLALASLWGLNAGLRALMDLGEKIGADVPFCMGAVAFGNPDLGFSSDPLAAPAALAEGIGEILTPLPSQGGQVHLLKPPAGVSTARLYQMYDEMADRADQPASHSVSLESTGPDFVPSPDPAGQDPAGSPDPAPENPASLIAAGPSIPYRAGSFAPVDIPAMPMDPKDMYNVFEPLTAGAWPDVARILSLLKTVAPASASKVMMSGSGPTVFLWTPPAFAPPNMAQLDLPPETLYLRSECL